MEKSSMVFSLGNMEHTGEPVLFFNSLSGFMRLFISMRGHVRVSIVPIGHSQLTRLVVHVVVDKEHHYS